MKKMPTIDELREKTITDLNKLKKKYEKDSFTHYVINQIIAEKRLK